MNFSKMHEHLRTVLLRKIQRGELTNSMLARQCGLTRSHISKFLHANGRLSIHALDRILESQHLRIVDLVQFGPHIQSRTDRDMAVPVVSHSAALFEPEIRTGSVQMWLPLPNELLHSLRPQRLPSRQSWRRFVAIRMDREDVRSMDPLLYEGAIAVLDRHYTSRVSCHPPRSNLYAVRDGLRIALRYIDFLGTHLVTRPLNIELSTKLVEIASNANPGAYIAGRVILILNEV